jgi:hypothetical protein
MEQILTTENIREDTLNHLLGQDFIFTQYLYSVQDICQSLATNILLKNKEKTLFWTKELVQSELTDTLIIILWNIYFTYYFPLNPEFYNYLLKQTIRIRASGVQPITITDTENTGCSTNNNDIMNAFTDIVNNLMIRPFTSDVLREGMRAHDDKITQSYTIPTFFGHTDIPDSDIMDTTNVEHIITHIAGQLIKPTNRKKIATLFRSLDKLRKNPDNTAGGDVHIPIDIERAARTALIAAYATKQKMGKALFVPPSNIQSQDTSSTHNHPADKTLQTQTYISMSDELSFCAYDTPIQDGSECIEGASDAMRRAFQQHWEYYAYRAPLWERRIEAHRGTPDHHTQRIRWDDDDMQEQFYQSYGYDPDEAGTETVRRCIAINMRRLTTQEYCTLIDESHNKN